MTNPQPAADGPPGEAPQPLDGGLSTQLARVEAKVDQLLALGAAADPAGEPVLWALEGLRDRAQDPLGEVLFTGTATLPSGERHVWQQGGGVGALMDADWAGRADALDALAHPVRLQLLQQIAMGMHSTAELAAAEGLGTTGQLHHHLRQLVASGWLRRAGRGRYELPAGRAIPLLVILLAAER